MPRRLGITGFGEGQTGALQLAFTPGTTVVAGTYPLADELPFGATLTTLRYQVGSAGGSFTVTINNAGSAVTGMSGIAVSSSARATATGTANLNAATGSRIEAVISAVTGSPTGAILTLNFTRT